MGEVVIYQAGDGKTRLEVQLEQEAVWLNQAQLVDLFQRDQSVLSRHIRIVFKEGELNEKSNLQKMQIANADRPVDRDRFERGRICLVMSYPFRALPTWGIALKGKY